MTSLMLTSNVVLWPEKSKFSMLNISVSCIPLQVFGKCYIEHISKGTLLIWYLNFCLMMT
jgi:hypothetical protein